MDLEQRSDEWYQARLGIPTASKYIDVVKGPKLAGYQNYKAELLVERLTGVPTQSITTKPMEWGIEHEPTARLLYSLKTKTLVEEVGFVRHPEIPTGASADGLIGTDGGLEIKCPNTATHIETLRTGKIPYKYIWQVIGGMWIYDRQWWDFVSFDPRLPGDAQMIVIREKRNEDLIDRLKVAIRQFNEDLDKDEQFILNYGKTPVGEDLILL